MSWCAQTGVPPIVPGAQRFPSHAILGPGLGAQQQTVGSLLSLRAWRNLQPIVPGPLEMS